MSHPVARAGADLRLLRAAVFTAVCVALSAAGHITATSTGLPWWSLGLGFLAVFALVTPCAGRERSLPVITVTLAAGQVGLHVVFGLGQHHSATGGGTGLGGGTGVGGGSDGASVIATATQLVCGGGAARLGPAQAQRIVDAAGFGTAHPHTIAAGESTAALLTAPMLLGHLLAALAAGWLLRRGEMALFRLVRLSAQGVAEASPVTSLRGTFALVRALHAGLPRATPPGPRVHRAAFPVVPRPRTTALQHSVIRRGPPASGPVSAAACGLPPAAAFRLPPAAAFRPLPAAV